MRRVTCAIVAAALVGGFMPAIAQATDRRPSTRTVEAFQIPAGAPLLVKLRAPIDAATAAEGDQIEAAIWSPVMQRNTELVPADSTITGRIESITATAGPEAVTLVVLTFSVIEHSETQSRAAIRTRPVALRAIGERQEKRGRKSAPVKPSGVIAAGATFTAILAEPLQVRIPK